ncbi:AraC family transcriptional regulator [Christiangramia flava]|uniref:Transcriptional regulator, AraC family n=1 Tax=Christiangramia flava JLT2011 TaxID=1229726 RepID=A0A1L7I9U6_9FLAO|nr:AraC family transcriptional regulator [Christiangramia flava]APU70350.1 Transcriptional regulator, AraC family [Christiangramia flava JLT2011]OSS37523.1 Transcriptional regulator, AraC family [Christiangramia flava JLT2011]
MVLPESFYKNRKLENLVENQTSYTLNNAALHIFETHQQAERVLLQFDQPVLASMLKGKKIMHLREQQSFDFLPGESLILPSNELMCIDFPEARDQNPTKCLAMAISEEKIRKVLGRMNELMPKTDNREWQLIDYNFHFTNDIGIYQILQRLIFLFTENHPSKDLFVDNMLDELVIRILQTNSRKIYNEKSFELSSSNRLAYVVAYIRENLHKSISVEELSQKACMSESNFYRVFKNELGISPTDFINNERIKLAVSLLQNPKKMIKEVYLECGFESRSYFNRVFKARKSVSPGEFQAKTAGMA